MLQPVKVPLLKDSVLSHGFFGRRGGVSMGGYESLNVALNAQDDPANVMENRARIAAALGAAPESLLTVRQTHSAICHPVQGHDWQVGEAPEGDALVTDRPGVALGMMTADCGPVLFYGEKADGSPVIGAAHAGWGGAVGGVLEATLDGMDRLGARRADVIAVLGPCLAQASYEVSAGFEEPFIAHHAGAVAFFQPGRAADKLMFDMPGYIAFRLRNAGLQRIAVTGQDTFAQKDDYFSHRRMTVEGRSQEGRQMSAIMIRP